MNTCLPPVLSSRLPAASHSARGGGYAGGSRLPRSTVPWRPAPPSPPPSATSRSLRQSRAASPPCARQCPHAPTVQVNLGLLAADVGVAATNTTDGGQGVHNLVLAVHVRVQHTQNVREVLGRHQRLQLWGNGIDNCGVWGGMRACATARARQWGLGQGAPGRPPVSPLCSDVPPWCFSILGPLLRRIELRRGRARGCGPALGPAARQKPPARDKQGAKAGPLRRGPESGPGPPRAHKPPPANSPQSQQICLGSGLATCWTCFDRIYSIFPLQRWRRKSANDFDRRWIPWCAGPHPETSSLRPAKAGLGTATTSCTASSRSDRVPGLQSRRALLPASAPGMAG